MIKDKKFYRTIFLISLPIIAQNLITIGVNMMDTIMLGHYGEAQLSGSSLANDFINIFQILCMGLGCGAAVLTAQYWGAKNIEGVKKTTGIMLRVALIVGTLFTIVTALFPSEIMGIYTTEKLVIENGMKYFRWSLPTYLLTAVSLTLTQILRSVRKVRIPLYASIGSFFLNIFFNWVFIFGRLGAPEMQISGAALGTVIARVFEFVIIGGYFFVLDQDVHFRVMDLFTSEKQYLSRFLQFSTPVIFSDLLLGVGNTALAIIVGHLGVSFTAAYAIIAVIQRFTTVFTSGLGMGAHTIVGNRVGEGNREAAYHEAVTLMILGVMLGLASALLTKLAGPWILQFYRINHETRSVAMEMINATSIMIVFQSMQSIIIKGILRGGGDTKFCLMVDAVFLWLVSIPLGYMTGMQWHMNAFIVFVSLKADWVIKTLLGTGRVLSGKWIKEVS